MNPTTDTPFASYIQARIDQITERCTQCGKCFEACSMLPYTDLEGAEPSAVTRSVVDIINDRGHAPEGAAWVQACQKSGSCIDACPEDVNPREMILYARVKLQQSAFGREELSQRGRNFFRRLSGIIRATAAIQTPPELYRRLTAVRYRKKAAAQNLFYFGCHILKTPHILLSCMDVFDRMGLDCEVVGGLGHCCGINHFRMSDLEAGAAMGTRSLEEFRSYGSEQVITFCPTCQMQYTEYRPLYSGPGDDELPFVHVTKYLARNLDTLKSLCTAPVNKRIALHLHGGTDGVEENVKAILACVPGLEVVEIDQHKDHGYQCPTLLLPGATEAMREKLLSSARAAEVDSVVTVYHSCHFELCPEEGNHPFELENFMTILGQSMGFDYPDWTKTFKLYGDLDRVLAETGDQLRRHGIDPEKARGPLKVALNG